MNSLNLRLVLGVVCLLLPLRAAALSRDIGRDIEFPKNFSVQTADAIRSVIRDERFKFVGGLVSYWPPDWGTRLSYEGDAASLNTFLEALRGLPGMELRVVLYRGRDDERRRDSSWQLDFSHARPNQLTVYLNLNSASLDWKDVKLPIWPAGK
jgi:hypothetical protein